MVRSKEEKGGNLSLPIPLFSTLEVLPDWLYLRINGLSIVR